MKYIFLLLVFFNAVLLLWGFSVSDTQDSLGKQVALYNQKDIESLVLLTASDLEDRVVDMKQTVAATQLEVGNKTTPESCYFVGSFKVKRNAEKLRDEFAWISLDASIAVLPGSQKYWAVYPVTGVWESSLKKLAKLKAKGVKDLWLISDGVDRGVISLGIFDEANNAKRRLDELREIMAGAIVIARKEAEYRVRLKTNDSLNSIKAYFGRQRSKLKKSILTIAC